MTKKSYDLMLIMIVIVSGYVIIRHLYFNNGTMSLGTDVIQGILIGFGLAIVTAGLCAKIMTRTINGWSSSLGSGDPKKNMVVKAANVLAFPGPINSSKEAVYWTTSVDSNHHSLSGSHKYQLKFAPGHLPPNEAFWSVTMVDSRNRFVPNSIKRYSIASGTALRVDDDGTTTIYIQNSVPVGHESNWLPAPSGRFTLWLRVYLPGEEILSGTYGVPSVKEMG